MPEVTSLSGRGKWIVGFTVAVVMTLGWMWGPLAGATATALFFFAVRKGAEALASHVAGAARPSHTAARLSVAFRALFEDGLIALAFLVLAGVWFWGFRWAAGFPQNQNDPLWIGTSRFFATAVFAILIPTALTLDALGRFMELISPRAGAPDQRAAKIARNTFAGMGGTAIAAFSQAAWLGGTGSLATLSPFESFRYTLDVVSNSLLQELPRTFGLSLAQFEPTDTPARIATYLFRMFILFLAVGYGLGLKWTVRASTPTVRGPSPAVLGRTRKKK